MSRVAIIGGGPSGICSAKYCVEYGLLPTVFEKNSTPGGLWIPNSVIWASMHTNFTTSSMVFSDFPWPENSDFFYPHRDQMLNYLQEYIKHFSLSQYFNLNTRVESAKQAENSKWTIKYTHLQEGKNETFESEFDYLIVASGFNTIPNEPNIEDKDIFTGLIMHSSTYKTNDEQLKDKNVLVIGSSNSSVEIASNLVGYSKSVSNLFNRPFWVVPKFIKSKNAKDETIEVPRDFLFYTREFNYSKKDKYLKYAKICPDQTNKETAPPDLYIDPNYKLPVNFGVSQSYYKYVKEGKIKTIKNKLKRYTADGVELEDGTTINTDVVLYCTGYKLQLPFFDDDILKLLKFDKDNMKNPIVLYKHTFHPSIDNAAFIFLTRGGFFNGIELQSKWAALVLSGKKQLPLKHIMVGEIERNAQKRKTIHPSVQFPHGLYVEIVDELAKAIGVYPDIENFEDSDFKEKFWKYLVQPSNFIYNQNKESFYKCLNVAEKITNGVKPDEHC